MIEDKELAKRISSLRQAAKISQEELGSQIGVSKSAISSFEKGKSQPSIDSLLGLARFFSTSVDYLLTGQVEYIPLGSKKRIGDKEVDAEDTARHRLAVAVQVMRLNCNMSVSEAAEQLGIAESYLKSIEIGEEYINNDLLDRIHELYKPEDEISELTDKHRDSDEFGIINRYYKRLVNGLRAHEKELMEEVALLREENQNLRTIINRQDTSLPLTPEQWNQAMDIVVTKLYNDQTKNPETEKRLIAARANAQVDAEVLMRNYRISINHPERHKLSDRLNITEEEARELVLSGRIRSTYIGPDNDRARRNGSSYLIPEWAVREFLQNTSDTSQIEQNPSDLHEQ